MTHDSDLVFRSRVDRWLGVILAILALAGPVEVGVGIYLLVSGGSSEAGWTLIGSGAFLVLLMVLVVWPVRYVLEGDRLVIRFGVFRSRIAYDRITGVHPTRTLLSSPALSMDRLQVDYKRGVGMALISPLDKAGFLAALAARAPHLMLEGDRLVTEHRSER